MKTIQTRFTFIMLMMVLSVKSFAQTPTVLWCEGNNTLYFLCTSDDYQKGEFYHGQTISDVWTGTDFVATKHVVYHYDWGDVESDIEAALWYDVASSIEMVVFEPSSNLMKPWRTYSWFSGFTNLKKIEGLEFLNTSGVMYFGDMFSGCSSLQSLDVSNFDTTNAVSMDYMFSNCSSLQSIDLSNFNTTNVYGMNGMFNGCTSLHSLDLSNFNTSKVTGMMIMFFACTELTNLDISSFNTNNVQDMSWMFACCNALQFLDVSNFNTSNVRNMSGMFSGCTSLTSLDVSGFNVENVKFYPNMFSWCNSLKTIYSNDSWNAENSSNMFLECECLAGAVPYDPNRQDASMANPDTGYFTRKHLKKGDVNLDENVDISDIVAVINHIAGTARYTHADVNNDSNVDISDIVAIINIIANGDDTEEEKDAAVLAGLCPDNNHPHAINLGLGVKWACCNVGASDPWEYGGYYAWGETEEKSYYDYSTYIHSDGSWDTCHDLGSDIAGSQYDVASVKWGGAWRMPTYEQLTILYELSQVNGQPLMV